MASVLLNLLRFVFWPRVFLKYSISFEKKICFLFIILHLKGRFTNFSILLAVFIFKKLMSYSGTLPNCEWLLFYDCVMLCGYLLFSPCSHRFVSCSPAFHRSKIWQTWWTVWSSCSLSQALSEVSIPYSHQFCIPKVSRCFQSWVSLFKASVS